MKQPKSTRNKNTKDKFDFKSNAKTDAIVEERSPRKRKMTEDQVDDQPGKLTDRKHRKVEDQLHISSESSEEDMKESSSNTFGFVPRNNLSSKKHEIINPSKTGNPKTLKEASSFGAKFKKNKLGVDTKKDVMKMPSNKAKGYNTTHDWHNDKNLETPILNDSVSKRSKRSKNSRIGSRDGSHKGRRHKTSAFGTSRKHHNRSKINRRVLHTKKSIVVFNEFQEESRVNDQIGVAKNENASQFDKPVDPANNRVDYDDADLDQAVNYNYTLEDRSYSFDNSEEDEDKKDDNNAGEENFVEVVEQNRFEKLEKYRDRCPCLKSRKFICKIRLMITKLCHMIISNEYFDYVSLLVIVANSVVLTMEDPTDPESGSSGFLETLDTIFLVCYTVEMVLKVIGLGLIFNKDSYLSDPWNILDGIIVLSAYLQLLLSSGANLSVLRSFRVLRPLRTISGIEGLRIIVSSLMKAVSLLFETVLIMCFFFLIFAIAGVQLWTGVLKKRCIEIDTGKVHPDDLLCGSVSCPSGYFCGKTNANPNFGVTNFDNIFYSLLTVFQSFTLEGWSVIMVQVQKVFNILSYFFFIPLVFIGPFFLLNLTMVVIKSEFTREHDENRKRKRLLKFNLRKIKKLDEAQVNEARSAFVKAKVKNNKIRFARIDRRDSDDSRAESRHRHNLNKLHNNQGITKNFDSKPESRAITAKSGYRPTVTMRPLHGISGLKKKRVNNLGDPITEEMSNSELSLMNQNNIFYPSNISAHGAADNEKVTKGSNAVYLKKGKGKIRMEGMYGISKLHDGNNELGSNSDLLDDIPLSNDDDGEVDDGSDSNIQHRDSEIMLPLDSSLSENSKPDKKAPTGEKVNSKGTSGDKGEFLISEGSFEFDGDDSKISPDKMKNNVDRKNTNYFTGTNFSSNDNDLKTTAKKGFRNNSLRRGKHDDRGESIKLAKNTKITSKIEGFSNFGKVQPKKIDKTSKLKDFNIKNIIFRHIQRKQDEMEKSKSEDFSSHGEGDDETEEKKQDKQDTEIREEDLAEVEANKILVVKKGRKITVKRDVRFDPVKDTAMEDILLPKVKRVDDDGDPIPEETEKVPKTTIAPHCLMRELELNEIVLEGKVEVEEEPANELEELKPGETKNLEEHKEEDKADEKGNNYLEKFKFPFRSNIVATGTISLVVTLKDTESYIDIPNPCAESYGAIIVDDISSEDEEESRDKVVEKKAALRRNDTLLPGGLLRQNTSTSKGLSRRVKTMRRQLANRNNMKRKARDEEEYSEENILKRIKLDIPEDSEFFKRVDIEEYKKEQEEEDMLDEGEDDNESEDYYEDDEDIEEMDDIFLDREIDFDKEVKRACDAAARRPIDQTEWSGQDIKINYDPYYAKIAVGQLTGSMVYPYGAYGLIVKLRGYLKDFVLSSFFDNLMTIAVAINTIVLSLDRHGISESDEATLTSMNTYFTYIFIAEMGLKLIGQGPVGYLQDRMNYLDGMVVILSIFELAFLSGGGAFSAFRAFRIMRTFRVLRVARLLKSMQSMQEIIDVIARSMSSFLYLAILLLLFVFIYALLGMQTFGGKFEFEDGKPRANFDSFHNSFITVFQLLTMENWQVILYDTMRSDVNKVLTAVYLISWIFIGNFMLLQLFLAILLDSFADENDNGSLKSREEIRQEEMQARQEFLSKTGEDLVLDYTDLAMSNSKNNKSKGGGFVKQNKKKLKNDKLMDESFEIEEMTTKEQKKEIKAKKPDYEGVECERSFYFVHKDYMIRKLIYRMTESDLFENVVLVLIILSSIKLAYDTYILDLPDSAIQKQISDRIDLFFTIFFLLEAVLKCTSMGFVQDNGSYLRESWNQLDFFIVCASIFDLAFTGVDIPAIKILRILRTLRPLRFISHNNEMKLYVTALLESVGHIFNVFIVIMMVFLMFAILAVNLFKGKMFYCSVDPYVLDTRDECETAGGKFQSYDANFDNVPKAMLTLFIVSSLEGWPDIMLQAVDGAGIEVGPRRDINPIASYFFVVFIFIGAFFFQNFFVGVIFLNYEEAERADKASWFMTYREFEWVDVMKMIRKAEPDLETTNEPKQKVLNSLHGLVTSKYFEIFIMVCIVLNMITMGMTYDDEPANYTLSLLYMNYLFSAIFLVECILKLLAFRHTYFHSSWNVFDFIVVIGSIIDILMSTLDASSFAFLRAGPQLVRILRILRVSRLLRLINKYPGLQGLIKTIMFSLPSLISVFSLLMLIYFIFAILGVFIFNDVKEGDVIDGYVNFKNFGYAMIMCIRVSTGEDWNRIMFDTANTDSDCEKGKNCGTAIAPLYFVVFIVICSYIMLNLFVLVILNEFDKYFLAKNNILVTFGNDLEMFKTSWTKFTTENNCIKMKDNKLVKFFMDLKRPLGMTEEDRKDINEVKKNIVMMDIRADDEGYIYFNELLYKVMRKTYGIKHIRNRKLASEEQITFKKINKLQKERSKKDIWDDKRATAVNPFLAVMYYNISFQTWLNKARKRMELEALNDNIAGSEESNEDFSDILNDPEEVSQISEGSFITFRQEEVASSSSNFGSESGIEDDSQSSEFATITENEELEDGEKEHPDASFEEGFKGKRLFNDKEEEEIERKMNIPTHIMETDERKEEDVLSEGERQLEDKKKRSIFEKLDSKSGETSQFDKRKSSAPDPEPYNLPKIEKNSDNLKIIEENHLEQTFSVENKSNDDQV